MNANTAYDIVDYPPLIHVAMHPAKLGAIGRLLGVPAATPRDCRLLEVGCGDALQLIALAQAYPESRFIGVDLSSNAIARGEALRVALKLDNLRLVAADLTDWDPGPDPYDYIVAHGFYSWVPPHVRERLLALCNETLAPAGIAYISYNAMPGCHLRRMVWDMMRFHVRDVADPGDRLRAAREFLAWLGADAMERGAYGAAVRHEARHLLDDTHPAVVFHDDLAAINNPFSVTEFVSQCRAHGLEFLAEADYHELNPALLGKETRARYDAMCGDDRVVNDQYLDFLKGRRFRQSLLCRRDAAPHDADLRASATLDLDAGGHIRAETAPGQQPAPSNAVRFASSDGASLTTDHPVVVEALHHVSRLFPRSCPVPELLAHARQATASAATFEDDARALSLSLTRAFELGLIVLQLDAPRFAGSVPARPLASPLARAQLDRGSEMIANLRPSIVSMDSRPAIELLRLLDGTRDREAILADLADRMATFPVPGQEGEPAIMHPASWWRDALAPTLEDALALCVRNALLVDEPAAGR